MADLKSSRGERITQEMIDSISAEAEAGYDPKAFRPRRVGRPPLGKGTSLIGMRPAVDPVVRQVLAAIRRQDWDRLKPLLHPYLHWTGRDGHVIRGRKNVLACLASMPATGLPRHHEIRDAQIYRWVESTIRS
jgi:hypothetical protein